MTPHQGNESAIPGTDTVQVPPTSQEVMIDDADHMEAVGHNARVREMQPDKGAIVGGQVHAHRAHLGLAFQPLKIGLQRQLRPAQDHVIDLVIS